MATTPTPLVWDFYRQIGNDAHVKTGGVVHYYDETAQTIFVNGGLKTRLSSPVGGQWETAELTEPSQFINEVDYSVLKLDHPANGTLYMAAIVDGNLQYLRYVYAADLSSITAQVTYSSQADNPITQISASVKNISSNFFTDVGTLFNPGAKLSLGISYGDSDVYPIGVAYLDEFSFDPKSGTVPVSGRNAIGYFLKESKFGAHTHFEGLSHEVSKALADFAGVPKFIAQVGSGNIPFDFEPQQTVMEGFEKFNIFYNSLEASMRLAELPDGTVISGYDSFVENYQRNSYYTFVLGKEVFSRKTSKTADGAYSGVYVTGKDANGEELAPVSVAVDNYRFWNIPANKLLFITAPDGLNQVGLQSFAESEARKQQYIGIGEDFTGPLRPQLLVGDVAEIQDSQGNLTTLGIITEVRHTLGENEISTAFSVDSGGEYTVITNGVRSTVSAASGYNRRQRMVDIIKIVSTK